MFGGHNVGKQRFFFFAFPSVVPSAISCSQFPSFPSARGVFRPDRTLVLAIMIHPCVRVRGGLRLTGARATVSMHAASLCGQPVSRICVYPSLLGCPSWTALLVSARSLPRGLRFRLFRSTVSPGGCFLSSSLLCPSFLSKFFIIVLVGFGFDQLLQVLQEVCLCFIPVLIR